MSKQKHDLGNKKRKARETATRRREDNRVAMSQLIRKWDGLEKEAGR